ncbi:Uu.00g094600.m01.CDS01 [Anthostomella pinea]|uniref:Uu.00g094600.m01.CDS01 n=1 Tax=Anthostomella pinea TaxID=933095 RepID=A0AAI8VNN2_9PEZI|nr:Uu.00g094600.m01.CDS01 [Anthostomella pinea]
MGVTEKEEIPVELMQSIIRVVTDKGNYGLPLERDDNTANIGFIDADNYVPGYVHEYCKIFAAGLYAAHSPHATTMPPDFGNLVHPEEAVQAGQYAPIKQEPQNEPSLQRMLNNPLSLTKQPEPI